MVHPKACEERGWHSLLLSCSNSLLWTWATISRKRTSFINWVLQVAFLLSTWALIVRRRRWITSDERERIPGQEILKVIIINLAVRKNKRRVCKVCFCHKNIKSISSCQYVMFFLLHRQKPQNWIQRTNLEEIVREPCSLAAGISWIFFFTFCKKVLE